MANKYAPEFHAYLPGGWINDPNGFCFFGNRFHLFAQANPGHCHNGAMKWAHFVSSDGICFSYEGIALDIDHDYERPWGCFSGTALVEGERMAIIYTAASEGYQRQCLAYSEDGIEFYKYQGNPILDEYSLPDGFKPSDFRDPKLFEEDGYYYALIGGKKYDGTAAELLFKGKSPESLKFFSIFYERHDLGPGMMECPGLEFIGDKAIYICSPQHLKGQGEEDNQNIFSSTYVVGHVDWEEGKFVPEGKEREFDGGFDFYAPQCARVGERLFMVAWLNMWERNYPSSKEGFVGSLSAIRELSLDGDKLLQSFPQEWENYQKEIDYHIGDDLPNVSRIKMRLPYSFGRIYLNDGLYLDIDPENGILSLYRLAMDEEIKNSDGTPANRRICKLKNDDITLDMIFDHSLLEIIVGDGELSISSTIFYQKPNRLRFEGVEPLELTCFELIMK